jgi:hypothetical protein
MITVDDMTHLQLQQQPVPQTNNSASSSFFPFSMNGATVTPVPNASNGKVADD